MAGMTDKDYEKLWEEARADPKLEGHEGINDFWVSFIESMDEKFAEGKWPPSEKQKAKIVEFHDMIVKGGGDNDNKMDFGNGITAERSDRKGFIVHLNGKPVGSDHTVSAVKAVCMFILNYADKIADYATDGGGKAFADDPPTGEEFDDNF